MHVRTGEGGSTGVTMRSLQPNDKDRLLEWRNRPDVARYMYTDHIITPDEHERWWNGIPAHEAAGTRKFWIIESEGLPVGLANLYDIDTVAGRCSWAFYLADTGTRGKGIGSAVERMVLDYVFETLKLRKLWCEVLATNEAVCRLHEKFGFVREATFRQHVVKGGIPVDVHGYGLLTEDFFLRLYKQQLLRQEIYESARRYALTP